MVCNHDYHKPTWAVHTPRHFGNICFQRNGQVSRVLYEGLQQYKPNPETDPLAHQKGRLLPLGVVSTSDKEHLHSSSVYPHPRAHDLCTPRDERTWTVFALLSLCTDPYHVPTHRYHFSIGCRPNSSDDEHIAAGSQTLKYFRWYPEFHHSIDCFGREIPHRILSYSPGRNSKWPKAIKLWNQSICAWCSLLP